MESYQEKAETLSQRFGISRVDAMRALEESDGDILDAVSLLEAQGIIRRTSACFTTAKTADTRSSTENTQQNNTEQESSFKKSMKAILDYGLDNKFIVFRNDKRIAEMPLLLLIIMLLLCFWITLPLIAVGLFFGCRYKFEGTGSHSELNSVMDKASESAENLKNKYGR